MVFIKFLKVYRQAKTSEAVRRPQRDAPPLHLTNKTFYAITLPIHVPDNHVRITDHPDRINAPVGHWAEYDERKQQSSAVNKQNKPGVSNLTPEEAKQTMLLKIKHAKLYETKY